MAKGISKKMVVSLVILAIILSVSFTFMILKSNFSQVEEEKSGSTQQSAQVGLTVLPPEPEQPETEINEPG